MSFSRLSERDIAPNARSLAGRALRVLLAPLMLAGTLTVIATGSASASTCVSSAGTQPVNPSSTVNVLTGVAALSACNVWAVGYYRNDAGDHQTLIEHWDGTSWTQVPSPNPGSSDNQLNSVAVTSASNAWAVGYFVNGTGTETLIEHWDGTSWTQVPSPSPGTFEYNYLYGVTAMSAGSAWAVGYYLNTFNGSTWDTLIEHWNGKNWQQVASPNPSSSQNGLSGVAATSGGDAWAVGSFVNGSAAQTLIEHWNGKNWQQVPSPNPGGPANSNGLSSVTATSASNAWAVGSYYNGTAAQSVIEQWNGSAWTQVPSPDPTGSVNNVLGSVAATSASNAWAVGYYDFGAAQTQTLMEQWNGSTWTQVPSPDPGALTNVLSAVSATATTMWAVGDTSNGAGTPTETLGAQ